MNFEDLKNNPRLKKIHDDRLKILKIIREFFWSEGFVEAETPLALRLPGQEPYLSPVSVSLHDEAANPFNFYLRTSPEFALKKLLGAGFDKVFELGKCFRDYESFGGIHSPEFTMLEWYRSDAPLEQIMTDTENLFRRVLESIGQNALSYRGRSITAREKWERVSMKELFERYLQVNLDEYLDLTAISSLATNLGFKVDDGDRYEDIFFKIFLNKIEPNLGLQRPVFVYDYPEQMCSLSRPSKNQNYAERFELYVLGLEVANAFGELTDGPEQLKRLEEDRKLRMLLGKPVWPVDTDFIQALGEIQGNPSGIALGVDRMVLLCTAANDLNDVIFSGIKDQLD